MSDEVKSLISHLTAVALELMFLVNFMIRGDMVSMAIMIPYAYFSATWALAERFILDR